VTFHPIAGLFPEMDADAFGALKASISEHGVLVPALTCRGQILDGRHRDRACRELGIACPTIEWDGREPWLALQALNLRRRHLSAGQVAAIVEEARRRFPEVAALVDRARAEALARKAAGQRSGGRGRKKLAGSPAGKFSSDVIGESVGVSGRTVRLVEQVARQRPDLVTKVASGAIGIGRAVQLAERERSRRLRSEMIAALPDPSGDHGVLLGDFREVGRQVPDGSAALVFTDPPYDGDFADVAAVYRDLGRFAARVLAPGGSLVAYAWNTQLFDVQPLLADSLRFWWPCVAFHDGGVLHQARSHGVIVAHKPLLWFVKGDARTPGPYVADVARQRREKGLHPWQQGVGPARHFVEALTEPGDLVVDPFAGSGTTLVAAKELGRRWIGCEIDAETAKSARARVDGKAA